MERQLEAGKKQLPEMLVFRNAVLKDKDWVGKILELTRDDLTAPASQLFERWLKIMGPKERFIVAENIGFIYFFEKTGGEKIVVSLEIDPLYEGLGIERKLLQYLRPRANHGRL